MAERCKAGTGDAPKEGQATTQGSLDDDADDKAAKSKGCSLGRCRIRAFGASAPPIVTQCGTDDLDPSRSPKP